MQPVKKPLPRKGCVQQSVELLPCIGCPVTHNVHHHPVLSMLHHPPLELDNGLPGNVHNQQCDPKYIAVQSNHGVPGPPPNAL
eukprot:9676686-Alexandrium_andersonii.AAC.1